MKKINVYMDDIRSPLLGPAWVLVRSVGAAKVLLSAGLVNNMSLDHDMGLNEPTGYDLLCWMEWEQVWPEGNVSVHSSNPSAAERMRQLIQQRG